MVRLLLPLILLAASPAVSFGQETWASALRNVPLQKQPLVPASARPLQPIVLERGIALIAGMNASGIGEEAARVLAWVDGKGEVFLEGRGQDQRLHTRQGESLAISEALGLSLTRMNQYFGMTAETVANPVTHEDLKAAILSKDGVARIRSLFDAMYEARIEAYGKIIIPEIGGDATLGEGLACHEILDPLRPLFREVARLHDDPRSLAELYRKYPDAMKGMDEYGVLKSLLDRFPDWEAKDSPPKAKRDEIVRMTVLTFLQTAADTFVFDPSSQLEAITTQEWSGRYVGLWHTHPLAGEMPSVNDMEIAMREGQNLTIAFHPDGFDVYDLSPLEGASEPDLSKVKTISYRSADWRLHFQSFQQAIQSGP